MKCETCGEDYPLSSKGTFTCMKCSAKERDKHVQCIKESNVNLHVKVVDSETSVGRSDWKEKMNFPDLPFAILAIATLPLPWLLIQVDWVSIRITGFGLITDANQPQFLWFFITFCLGQLAGIASKHAPSRNRALSVIAKVLAATSLVALLWALTMMLPDDGFKGFERGGIAAVGRAHLTRRHDLYRPMYLNFQWTFVSFVILTIGLTLRQLTHAVSKSATCDVAKDRSDK